MSRGKSRDPSAETSRACRNLPTTEVARDERSVVNVADLLDRAA
jgi:hypothetical protein